MSSCQLLDEGGRARQPCLARKPETVRANQLFEDLGKRHESCLRFMADAEPGGLAS